jgi:uncharacterized protein YuzE
MLVRVDKEADAIYLELSNEPIESSEEVSDGVILDYTADGHLVGIEILQASQKSHADALKHINVAA